MFLLLQTGSLSCWPKHEEVVEARNFLSPEEEEEEEEEEEDGNW